MPPDDETCVSSGAVEVKYANCFNVGHNAFEFIVEFAQSYSDGFCAKVHTRIVTNPAYAKELLEILDRAVNEYERAFGPIPKR